MSKASEWAAAAKKKPSELVVAGDLIAEVDQGGGCYIDLDQLDAETALQLARWINETFGEAGVNF